MIIAMAISPEIVQKQSQLLVVQGVNISSRAYDDGYRRGSEIIEDYLPQMRFSDIEASTSGLCAVAGRTREFLLGEWREQGLWGGKIVDRPQAVDLCVRSLWKGWYRKRTSETIDLEDLDEWATETLGMFDKEFERNKLLRRRLQAEVRITGVQT